MEDRCPNLYWFNPACDLAAGRGATFAPRMAVRDLAHDLAMVPALLAAADDMIVVPERPRPAFLQQLQAARLPVPKLVVWEPLSCAPPAELAGRTFADLRPWGWSPDSVTAFTPLAGQLAHGMAHPSKRWHDARRQLYAKAWSAAWLADIVGDLRARKGDWICGPEVVGSAGASETEASRLLTAGFAGGWQRAVVKAAYGAAGGQQMIVGAADLEAHQQRWLRRALREAGRVVVEPWLDRKLDLSAQFEVEEDGCLRLLGITRFLADGRGRFQGVFVHNMAAGLEPEMTRLLDDDGRDCRRLLRLFDLIGTCLQQRLPADFRGALGVDAFVYRDAADGALRLKPIVEVNPRLTMGRVALALAPHILAASTAARSAIWRVLRVKDIVDAGDTDVASWASRLRQQLPLEMTPDGKQIARGVVFTNDPEQARSFVSLLVVGDDLQAIAAAVPAMEKSRS